MKYSNSKIRSSKGMSLVEMVLAVAIMVVVMAVIARQFRPIQSNWGAKQAAAETIQTGRILTDHVNRYLVKAVRISDVSEPSVTLGYIQFEATDGNDFRYEVDPNGYVQFGEVNDLSVLAGPVTKFQFTCYDAYDLDTSLDPISDANVIRFVKMETILTNSASSGRDKTLLTSAFLYTNSNNNVITKKTAFEFESTKAKNPDLAQVDSTHYLCAYSGDNDYGWAVIFTVDTDSWAITKETPFEHDSVRGKTPALAQIDSTHYLCAYAGKTGGTKDTGWASVLVVDTDTWDITKISSLEYDSVKGKDPALAQIDNAHYLCAYVGSGKDNGWVTVLTTVERFASTSASTETSGSTNFVVNMPSFRPDGDLYIAQIALEGGAQIDSIPSGWTEITDREVFGDTRLASYWKIGSSEPATYTWVSNISKKWFGTIHRFNGIDTSNPINASDDNTGDSANPSAPSITTTVDNCLILRMFSAEGDERASTYWPSGTTPIIQNETGSNVVSGAAYEYLSSAGSTGTGDFSMTAAKKWVAVTIAIAPATDGSTAWNLENETPFEYDDIKGKTPSLAKIDNAHYLCAYASGGDDGWAVVFTVNTDDWTISKETPFEYDSLKGKTPVLSKIDDAHYLCVSTGDGDDGMATILIVDANDWTISKGVSFEYDTQRGKAPDLAQINTNYYLCAYAGPEKDEGWAVVMEVDTSSWTISKDGSALNYETDKGKAPKLIQIDSTHYLCVYSGPDKDDGWAIILEADQTVKP